MKIRIGLLMMIGLALVSSLAWADKETQVSYSGTCEPLTTGNWTVVITYGGDGNVIRREGIACGANGGNAWVDHCPPVTLSGDPGIGSNYFLSMSGGAWLRFNISSAGYITDMWGKTVSGVYWKDGNSTVLMNFSEVVTGERN